MALQMCRFEKIENIFEFRKINIRDTWSSQLGEVWKKIKLFLFN